MAFENITYTNLLNRLMAKVPGDLDKREGSLLYNALAPAAAELKQLYIELDVVLNETFADSASRAALIRRGAERGLAVKPATHAVYKGVFDAEVPVGTRFSAEESFFTVTEQTGRLEYRLTAESAGSAHNHFVGSSLIPVAYIPGLTAATLEALLIPGEDEEDTEHFRKRYFNSFNAQAFGGNRADYTEKVNALPGVGGCKVYRTPEGNGSVGILLIDSAYETPSTELLDSVQETLDPAAYAGEGLGIAPIGHRVLLKGVEVQHLTVETQMSYAPGWNWEALEPYFNAVIDAYLLELRKAWAHTDQLIVRIAQIESRLLNLQGVVDITGTLLNGKAQNLVLEPHCVPKRGGLA